MFYYWLGINVLILVGHPCFTIGRTSMFYYWYDIHVLLLHTALFV